MNKNIKRCFSVDRNNSAFTGLDENGKILVESGLEAVKQYVAEKSREEKKQSFAQILADVNVDGRKKLDSEVVTKIVKYSLGKAGVDTQDFTISNIASPVLHNDPVFRHNFNVILSQIMSPVIPAMVSSEFMDFADISNIAWGDTAKFKVSSNDCFYVTKVAEGILDGGSVQRIYNDELTVNPEPYNIKTTVDWYQVASGVFDLGEFVYKIGASFSAYITQMIIGALATNITAGAPSAYFTNGFTTTKFARIAELLKAANGGANIRAYGSLVALSAIIPDTTNMQIQLGEEYSKVGYVSKYMGVDLMRIPQILLPNTVNTTPLAGIPDSTIYFFADGGYKPVKIVFEGSPITLDILPNESSDKEMGLSVTTRIGSTFVAASRYGAITGLNS